jgi:hypothetical protein
MPTSRSVENRDRVPPGALIRKGSELAVPDSVRTTRKSRTASASETASRHPQSSLVDGLQAAAAGPIGLALSAAKKGSGSIKEFADFDNFEYSTERVKGKGSKARVVRTSVRVSRGDWVGLGVLILGWEGLNAIASGLAKLDPLEWAEEIGAAVANDIVQTGAAVNSKVVSEPGLQTSGSTTTAKLGPPTGNPTTVGGALQYHILRGNARYQLARQKGGLI